MGTIEVFADVACPFAYVSLRRFHAYRSETGSEEPRLRVRAWPLETVNGEPHNGSRIAAEVEAMRAGVAADLFAGFDEDSFPATTLPALAAAAAAYRQGVQIGERFSVAVRTVLFEEGLDVSNRGVLRRLSESLGVPTSTDPDGAAVESDYQDGRRRGVKGSPHFFTDSGDFFCPSLDIHHEDAGFEVAFDVDGFRRFVGAAFP